MLAISFVAAVASQETNSYEYVYLISKSTKT